MLNDSYKRFFGTLGNENRLKIIYFLQENGSRNVSQIVERTNLEQTSVSHNLKALLDCHFVRVNSVGKERVYSLNEKTIKPLLKLIDKHVSTYCVNCEEGVHD